MGQVRTRWIMSLKFIRISFFYLLHKRFNSPAVTCGRVEDTYYHTSSHRVPSSTISGASLFVEVIITSGLTAGVGLGHLCMGLCIHLCQLPAMGYQAFKDTGWWQQYCQFASLSDFFENLHKHKKYNIWQRISKMLSCYFHWGHAVLKLHLMGETLLKNQLDMKGWVFYFISKV